MKIPAYFEFTSPPRLLAGEGALDHLPHELRTLGCNRPLVLRDPGLKVTDLPGLIDRLFAEAGLVPGAVFTDLPADAPMSRVLQVAALYRETGCDGLLGVGGGSVLDTAKAALMMISSGATTFEEIEGYHDFHGPVVPFVLVPTTAGTGSEATTVAVVSHDEKNIKMEIASPRMLPQVSVLDPRCSVTLPPKVTAATGIDALTHALEAFVSRQANPLSRVHALAAIELIHDHLETAILNPRDKAARHAMAVAAYLAGVSFSNAMVGAVHSLGHGLGAVCHLPHGVTMELLLVPVMTFNRPALDLELKDLARVWNPDAAGDDLPDFLESLEAFVAAIRQYAGLPATLSEAGVTREHLPQVVARAWMDGSLLTNPRDLTQIDLQTILEAAF